MGVRFFSTKNRPLNLGPYPLERLARHSEPVDISSVPTFESLDFRQLETPYSLVTQ